MLKRFSDADLALLCDYLTVSRELTEKHRARIRQQPLDASPPVGRRTGKTLDPTGR